MALTVACLVMGTALPFLLVPFEVFRFRDEPYQAYCCLEYSRAYPALLTFFAGNKWMEAFGQTFIALRYLMTVCFVSSAAVGYAYMRIRKVSALRASVVYMIIAIGLVLTYLPIYNWDSGAYPSTALGLLVLLLYIDSPSRAKAALMGAAVGPMILFRLPMVAALAVMTVFVMAAPEASYPKRQRLADVGTLTTCAAAIFMIGICVISGSPRAYISSFSLGNTVGGHRLADIPEIIRFSYELAVAQYKFMLPSLVAILLSVCFTKCRRHGWILWTGALLLTYYSVKTVIYNHGDWTFFWSHNGLLTPLAFVAIFFTPLYANLKGEATDRKTIWGVLALVAFMLLQGFGSDAVSERIGWVLAMAFAFGVNKSAMDRCGRFVRYMLIFSSASLLCYFAFVIRRLECSWDEPLRTRYTPAINGTRNYHPFDYHLDIDSVKFVFDNLRDRGITTAVVGKDCCSYTFILEETTPNSTMRYIPPIDEVIADIELASGRGAVIGWMDCEKDSTIGGALAEAGYGKWLQIGDDFSLYATDSVAGRLPGNPFREWGYEGPGE
ncbi:MAG: hypothetical protein NC391_01190 [Alistipes timonensis]|nr:hypothetical protein [Alistipes timonensis]